MEVHLNRGGRAAQSPLIYVPGMLCVAFGLLVIWNPELLHYFVGGAFICLGLLVTLLLFAVRRALGRGMLRGFGPGGFGSGPFGQP
jgi:hypothetical protein